MSDPRDDRQMSAWISAIRTRIGLEAIPDAVVQAVTEQTADILSKATAMLIIIGTDDPDHHELVMTFARLRLSRLAMRLEQQHTAEVRRRMLEQLLSVIGELLTQMQPSIVGVAGGLLERALEELLGGES